MDLRDSSAARLTPATRRVQKRRIPLQRRIHSWARRNTRQLIVVGCVLVVWLGAHMYWFNRLTDMEFNVQGAWAQVEAEQQRRYHIQQSFTRVVLGYAEHERGLMLELTELRTEAQNRIADGKNSGSAEDDHQSAKNDGRAAARRLDELAPAELDEVFPGIMMVAEQYPNLRLTENLQQLSTAIVETETRITERIATYNDTVNKYTTTLKQFPGNMFGTLWGFDSYEFHSPSKRELEFMPLRYGRDRDAAGIAKEGTDARNRKRQ